MSRPCPRVLVLGAVLGQPMGGVRRHNAELLPRAAELLAARGGSLAILEGSEPIALPLPPTVQRIASDVAAGPPLSRWRSEGPAVREALSRARASSRPFDLVHTAHLPAPRRLACPFTLTLHDLRSLEPSQAGGVRRTAARAFLASALRRARSVIVVSEAVRAELAARFRLDPARLRLVPNAADHFEPLPRNAQPGAGILHVGHLEKRKNLDVLLRALAVDPGLPSLVLAGAPKGREEERLRRLARELGILERVRFLGAFAESELPRLYARAACAVVPSRLEGFGIPALEAQRARVPLSISRTPALLEVAGEGTPAFDPDDAEACARAIRASLAAPAEAIEGAARRAARFTWQASATALVEAWCEAAT